MSVPHQERPATAEQEVAATGSSAFPKADGCGGRTPVVLGCPDGTTGTNSRCAGDRRTRGAAGATGRGAAGATAGAGADGVRDSMPARDVRAATAAGTVRDSPPAA
ncbi:hypothetical protein ACIQVL_31670, partial [Streptomyces sp. NPDC090499]